MEDNRVLSFIQMRGLIGDFYKKGYRILVKSTLELCNMGISYFESEFELIL